MTRLERLLWGWDEGTLSDEEKAELVAALEQPDPRRELVRHWTLSRGLSDALPLAAPAPPARRPARLGYAFAFAAAAALLLAVGGWTVWPRPAPLARLAEVSGTVEIVDVFGRTSPARPGQSLYAGQSVQAGDDDGYAAVEYPDTSRLELHSGSRIRLDPGRVLCSAGTVRAGIAGGSLVLATPQGEVHAREGQMLISASDAAMRVDLEEGNAEVLRTGDANAVEMGSGSYTIAAPGPDGPVVRPLPTALTRPLRQVEIRNGRALRYGPGDRIETVAPRGLRTATAKGEIRVHPLAARKADRFAFGGRLLAVGTPGQIDLFEIDPFNEREPIPTRGAGPIALAPDGSWLAWVDPRKGLLHHVPFGGQPWPSPVSLGGRGPYVLAALPNAVAVAGGGRVRVIGADRTTYTGLPDVPRLLAAAGDRLAAVTADGSLTVWQRGDPAPRHAPSQHARTVTALAFSPDGLTLAAGTADGQVWLFDAGAGEPTGVIRAGKRSVWGVAFHPDGRRLAVGVLNGPLSEWAIPSP